MGPNALRLVSRPTFAGAGFLRRLVRRRGPTVNPGKRKGKGLVCIFPDPT